MTIGQPYDISGKTIFVAGHRGMVGSALVWRLEKENCRILTVGRTALDLMRQADVERWMSANKPDAVIMAAAKVGGIHANETYPADFLYNNLIMETCLIRAAVDNKVEKFLFLGSSCVYPKFAEQPIAEVSLLSGSLEPTNEWYAIAKIAGVKLCEAFRRQNGVDFISAMPTNLYGPNDNFDLNTSHVLPALIRKAHEAKIRGSDTLTVWGTGTPRREFMHVDDCADALVLVLKNYSESAPINVGSGDDIAISDLARVVMDVVGLKGELRFDRAKPDGTPRKLMCADKLAALKWKPAIGLREGIESTYRWFLQNIA